LNWSGCQRRPLVANNAKKQPARKIRITSSGFSASLQKTLQNSGIIRFDPAGEKIHDARFIPIVPNVEEKFLTGFADAVCVDKSATIFDPTAGSINMQGLAGLVNGEIDTCRFAEAARLKKFRQLGKYLFNSWLLS